MAFINAAAIDRGILIGAQHGARRLFRTRERFAAGFFVGLHTHHGDESFEIREGEVRFTAGPEQKACRAGEIVFVPAGVEHGFVALTDACVEVFSEHKMGVFVVLEEGGGRRLEEIFIKGFPSSRDLPDGEGFTPTEHIRALYATTRHLF